MKPLSILVHVATALSVFLSFMGENFPAAVAWACCWLVFVGYELHIRKVALAMKAGALFIEAHKNRWPSKEAEDKAAHALAEFTKTQK